MRGWRHRGEGQGGGEGGGDGRGGRGEGEEEERGGGGQDLGTTAGLYLHLQTGGGTCLQAMGITFKEFKRRFRLRQIKLKFEEQLGERRSKARQQVSPGVRCGIWCVQFYPI